MTDDYSAKVLNDARNEELTNRAWLADECCTLIKEIQSCSKLSMDDLAKGFGVCRMTLHRYLRSEQIQLYPLREYLKAIWGKV